MTRINVIKKDKRKFIKKMKEEESACKLQEQMNKGLKIQQTTF